MLMSIFPKNPSSFSTRTLVLHSSHSFISRQHSCVVEDQEFELSSLIVHSLCEIHSKHCCFVDFQFPFRIDLMFSDQQIDVKGAELIAAFLKNNRMLIELNLWGFPFLFTFLDFLSESD
jgi:hypothetical protein